MPSPIGLPSLSAQILAGISTAQLDATVVAGLLSPPPTPVYGIFQNAQAGQAVQEVLTGYSSVVGFGFQRDQRLCTHPVEQGGFADYNKVALPFQPRLTYVVNGGPQNINAFLAQCEALVADTNLYTVINPYYYWPNANVNHYDFKQSSHSGVSMLTVDVWLEEVRQAPGPQYTSTGTQASGTATRTPDGQAQQQNGTIQPSYLGTGVNPFSMITTPFGNS